MKTKLKDFTEVLTRAHNNIHIKPTNISNKDFDNLCYIIYKNTQKVVFVDKTEFKNPLNFEKYSKMFSEIINVDQDAFKKIYYKYSGDLDHVVDFINNKPDIDAYFWTDIEDSIINSNNFNDLNELILKRGFDQVMSRKRFLSNYNK